MIEIDTITNFNNNSKSSTLSSLNFNCLPKLTLINQEFEVLVSFESNEDFVLNIDVSLELDIAFLKKEIKLLTTKESISKGKNFFPIKLNSLKLDNYEENELMNISVLKIKLSNKELGIFKEKVIIIQAIKDKGLIYKNLI